jgi:hypothetical protein
MISASLRQPRLGYLLILPLVLMGTPRAGEAQTCPNGWSDFFPGDGGFDGAVNALTLLNREL